VIFWGKLTPLQAGYLTQQVRAFAGTFPSPPSETVIDLLGLDLADQETRQTVSQLANTSLVHLKSPRLHLLVPSNHAADLVARAFASWTVLEPVRLCFDPEKVYPPLGIAHDSELCEQMKQAFNHPPQVDFTAESLEKYVSAHLAKPNINDACEALQLTRRTLQRRLYEAGTSFQKMVIRTRIRFAQKLLSETQVPVTQVASDVGFATLQAFSSAFRRETGLSPTNYRNASLNTSSAARVEQARVEQARVEQARVEPQSVAPVSGPRAVDDDTLSAQASA